MDEYQDLELVSFTDGYNNCKVRMYDINALNEGQYINDALLELYLNYVLMRELSDKDKNRSYLFNTFFYTRLTQKRDRNEQLTASQQRHERVKKWTKNVNIFEKDFIFIPINENFHWTLAVICFPYLTGPLDIEDDTPVNLPDERINYVNPADEPIPSCEQNPDLDEADGNTEDLRFFLIDYEHDEFPRPYEHIVQNLIECTRMRIKQPCILIFDSVYNETNCAKTVATLREYLYEEYRAKHNGAERSFSVQFMKGCAVKVPQQPNQTDCGLYVMEFFYMFFDRPIVDYTCPILLLENWFSVNEVTGNARKRKEILQLILTLMSEQNVQMPPGVYLPILNFMLSDPLMEIC